MSFNEKKREVSLKLLEAIDGAIDSPGGKNPEHLVLLAEAFAYVSEHGKGEPSQKQVIRKLN